MFSRRGRPTIAAPLAEALGRAYAPISRKQDDRKERIPTATVIAALVDALAQPNDHTLHHSLTYALLEIDVAPTLLDNLKNNNPAVRRALLMALENMDGGKLPAAPVVADLGHADAELRAAACGSSAATPNGAKKIAGFMSDRLPRKT